MSRIGPWLGCLLVVTGCATVTRDLHEAQQRAHAAQVAGFLGPADPLPACLDYLVGTPMVGDLTAVLKPPFAGVIDLGVQAYILDAITQGSGVTDELDAKCGGVAIKILRNAGRRAPGL